MSRAGRRTKQGIPLTPDVRRRPAGCAERMRVEPAETASVVPRASDGCRLPVLPSRHPMLVGGEPIGATGRSTSKCRCAGQHVDRTTDALRCLSRSNRATSTTFGGAADAIQRAPVTVKVSRRSIQCTLRCGGLAGGGATRPTRLSRMTDHTRPVARRTIGRLIGGASGYDFAIRVA
jgi:hypothetical protein